jgi:diaminopimelate decarboxylase
MLVNANSLAELPRLAPYSDRLRIGLRLNPMVATDSPDLFDVSRDDSKFGEPIANADAVLSAIRGFPVTALHVHPSSSMTSVDAAVRAVESVVALAIEANVQACESGNDRRIRVIDVGGGLAPEDPDGTDGSLMEEYARTLRDRLPELWSEFDLVTEFGQWVHFHTGYAASDVEYVVDRADRQVAFVHLGADFLLRDVYVRPRGIRWLPVRGGRAIEGAAQPTDLAGPLCFAGDFLARDIELPRLREGDHLIMLGTGSNALGLWSRHTSRDVPAVVGVDFAGRSLQVLSERFSPFVEPLG